MTRISKDDWEALRPLLDEALDLSATARQEWVARQRRSNPGLAAEVEALLDREAVIDREGFLAHDRAPEPPSLSSLLGHTLGPYLIERPLGSGGMGTVWLARRNDGRYEGVVAIKFLSLGVAGPVGEARFRREGSVLARLTHANIARLLDAGVSPSGQPYLVLEHVDGQTLDQWCDQRRLPVEQRIELFLQVLAAVAHAHANLIVHRDLKPDNIMVTSDGTVKLLDFGIAKLLDEGGAGRTLTRSHEGVMTLEYAAPEQIRDEPISTATDVYSLGVVLYQLLAGQHPTSARCRTPADHIRAILDTDPSPLSQAAVPNATLSAAHAQQLALARDTLPEKLRRQFAGDLDRILAKALRKDPAARYATATAFAEDLSRYLKHEPVSAAPDTLGYRARELWRRHRMMVSTAALITLVLLSATIVTAIQARAARRQRDEAVREVKRQHALSAVQKVLAGDSRGTDGRQLTSAERIALALHVLQQQFRGEPWLVAEVMVDLSGNFYESGDRGTQRSILAQAQRLARDAGIPAQLALANCLRVYSFAYDDVFDSAHTDLAEAKAAMARSPDLPREVERSCLDAEGQLLVEEEHPDSAIPLLTRAARQIQRDSITGEAWTIDRLQVINDLAQALKAGGRAREASRFQRQIVVQLDSAGYTDTELFPNATSFLVSTLNDLGEFAVAESTVSAIVREQEATHGTGHPSTIMGFLLGSSHLRLGNLDSAEIWITRSMRDTTEGAGGISLWMPHTLAQLRLDQHRSQEARAPIGRIAHFGRGFEVLRTLLQARVRWETHDSTGAMTDLEQGIRKWSGSGPRLPVDLAVPLITAGEWRLARGDWQGADSLARRARDAAAIDSLALLRSGLVGRADLVRARALWVGRDLGASRGAADSALVALTNGFGAGNSRIREAQALIDSLPR